MFSGFQDPGEYEDELYRDEEEDDDDSEPDSELEFQLYSQLHYAAANGVERPQEPRVRLVAVPQERSADVIEIDSSPDVITLSEEEEDSVCARKCQKSTRVNQARSHSQDVVVLDSESERSSDSESLPPFIADSDSDSLESWMILGQRKEAGDQEIQLNVLPVAGRGQQGFVSDGDQENWAVSSKDKEAHIYNKGVGSRRLSNRYYREKNVTCHNCNKVGHLSKTCPTPKKSPCCSLCGLQGHILKTCPNRYCSNCALPGHTYDACLERAYWHKRCHRCSMTGHFADACPDVWRQYHLTTKEGPPVESPDPTAHRSPAYCHNCSRKGHFGHECSERRMFNGTYPTLPFSSSYDTQQDIKRREHRIQIRAQELQEAGLLEADEAAMTPHPPRKKWKPSTPGAHTPKKRIAHTPKHPPQTTPKSNTHMRWTDESQTPGKKKTKRKKEQTTPGPHSAFIPLLQKKKKKKNNKLKNDEQDFPRTSPYNSAAHTPPFRSPGTLFSNKKSKKKQRRDEKRARNAEREDQDLFLIKQRKRRR